MKIALVSTGLGRVVRGFEAFTDSLFRSLRRFAPHVDVTLFQGGGTTGDGRVEVPNFHRQDVPARWLGYEKGNLLEKRSFALAIYPLLRKDGFDIVHYNELVMGSALFHLRRLFGGKYKLLYCNGAPSPPIHYHHRCDFAQVLTGPAYAEAREFGISENRLFLLPYGVDGDLFNSRNRAKRQQVRGDISIPENAIVVLTVAALNKWHKRIDYLIKEISHLDDSVWLLAAGQRTDETNALEREAYRYLPGRCHFLTWPHEKIHVLYGAADIFVLGSLTEGFGIVTVEAMLSGLPIILHRNDVNGWITDGAPVQLVDMSVEGELAKALSNLLSNGTSGRSRDFAKKRFSWEELVPQYVRMYAKLLEASSNQMNYGQ
ncbi:MAG TPA: glycosyltransferase family 4 protein [Syntrophorhabdales bacterium]|nr:glycosyltransferase family 4 protein [Syntrophorhabdales bacterium]